MAQAKLISLNLYPEDLMILDMLVENSKVKSFTPGKVNRSTVIRDLLEKAVIESRKEASQAGGN